MQLAVVTEAHGECRHHVLWVCVVHQGGMRMYMEKVYSSCKVWSWTGVQTEREQAASTDPAQKKRQDQMEK
jgi:hypothetical protein